MSTQLDDAAALPPLPDTDWTPGATLQFSAAQMRVYAADAVAADRKRLRVLVEAVRDANRDAEDGDTFRLLKPGQERAWMALLAGLEGHNVELSGHQRPAQE